MSTEYNIFDNPFLQSTEYNIFDSLFLDLEKLPTLDEIEDNFNERLDALKLSYTNYIEETRSEFNLSIEAEIIAAGMRR
jgi:hypothetical protein